MTEIIIDGEPIQVSVKPAKRARKTVEIEFKSKDELIISHPRNIEIDVEALLKKNQNIIQKKYQAFLSRIRILKGNTILYRGQPHTIQVIQTPDQNKSGVSLSEGIININVADRQIPQILLKKWLTTQTKALIEETRKKHTENLSDHPTRISITDTKRWGYCRKNGSIVFNWQIAALPPKLAEFIIIHEMVHLSHLNHQRGFHTKMIRIIPDYRQRERELQRFIAMEKNFEFYSTMG